MDFQFAPGSPILVGQGRVPGGAGCFLAINGGFYLLTAGHLFRGADKNIFVPGLTQPVATLQYNLWNNDPPIDAAVCKVTDFGTQLAMESATANTWRDTELCPGPEYIDRWVDVVRTGGGMTSAQILHHAKCEPDLFPGGPEGPFWALSPVSTPGDSGSIVLSARSYVGIVSGQMYGNTLLTSIHQVVECLAQSQEVSLCTPAS